MRYIIFRQGGACFACDGFDDRVGYAEYFAAEDFVVAGPADAEGGFLWPGFSRGVSGRPFCDGGRGTVGDEFGVREDVGDEGVEIGSVVGEGARGVEALNFGGERVGDELTSLLLFRVWLGEGRW